MKVKRYMVCNYPEGFKYQCESIWFTAGLFMYDSRYGKNGMDTVGLPEALSLLAVL